MHFIQCFILIPLSQPSCGQNPTQVASEAAAPNTSIFKWPVQPKLHAFSLPSMGETTVEFTTMTEDMAVKIMVDFELAQKAIFVLMSGAPSTEERDGFRIVSYYRVVYLFSLAGEALGDSVREHSGWY